MMSQATDLETAILWSKTLFLWPFMAPFMVHFALVFTDSELLKRKLTYVLLYLPAPIFSVIDFSTNLITATPTYQSWGYSYTAPLGSWIYNLSGLWAESLSLFLVFILLVYYVQVSDKTVKLQTKYVTLAFGVFVVLSLITDSVLPSIGIPFPGLGSISGAALSGFVVYAVWKYDLFTLNPAMAAETIVYTMPDALVLADLNGKILRVNQPLSNLLGYQEKELLNKSLDQLIADKTNGSSILAELIKKREIKNLEITCLTKSGVEKSVSFSGSVIKNRRGQDVGINCIFHDITHRKEMEQKLLRSERYASIGELAGMVGHDLRNPLTSIRGAVHYLRTKHASEFDAKDQMMFDAIEGSIEYSNKIINDLLDYSKEVVLEPEPATPKSLVANALSMVHIPTNVTVHESTDDANEVTVDKGKLVRVIVNIIANAVDAMPDGGTLTIKSENLGDRVLFSFEDTGLGMSAQTLSRLWTPLFTTKAKGMGFGLAICKRIVDAHGGKIWAESIQEKGAIVSFEIPIRRLGANN
jgi:PAS domain S-box-containing protein